MAFNHYARLKKIVESQPEGWVIKQINEPTNVKNFKNETVAFDYYYRLYDASGNPIRFGKFQQIERLASVLSVPVEALPIIDDM